MTYDFTPTMDENPEFDVPYFENASADIAPYYTSQKTIKQAKDEVMAELSKLGAGNTQFIEGYFTTADKKRYGYEIRFELYGKFGVLHVAGLPMEKETASRKERVQLQALLNMRDWLKTSVTQQVFDRRSNPLLLKLLTDGGQTIEERMLESHLALPESINGEFESEA